MKLVIDTDKFEVTLNGKEIILPRKEFEILCLLCKVPGKVFSRKNIFLNVWGEDSESKERTVDVHILNLRKKFSSKLIRTIKGVGYKITEKNILFIN
ncbi:MAG TPA: winged helix-turn-helix domain-containing protein [Bacteroidia bacterium]|nr:winged helix-turn-helix domain-containing protein [Bacteroidia bacterium]